MPKFFSLFSYPRLGIAAVLLACFLSRASAQIDRTSLSGTVSDSAGSAIPDIHVVVYMPDTGLNRETVTSRTGTYEVPELPVGNYTVTFRGNGFATLTFDQVIQTVGRTRTLNATLHVAGGQERVEVSNASALMDHNTSAVTGLIERTQADELPLNGRDWSALTAFVPGAIDTGGSNQRTVRFAGRGLDDSNFTYDGVDATNIVNQAQQSFVRQVIPTDAIQEFRIDLCQWE